MVYHPDLSICSAGEGLRIGWLDRKEAFTQGDVNQLFVKKLRLAYKHRIRQSRGFHVCPFCNERQFGIRVEIDGVPFTLGSAEVEIKSREGRVYIAPDLIYHYILVHQYLPPPEFIEAVCK